MSMNSRYRERKYNTSDNDRLLRALSQPVQAWEKKWTQHSNSKTLQTYKWIKSDKVIEFEQDEESEEEPEPMEIEQASIDQAAPLEVTTTTATTTTTIDQNNEPVKTSVMETTTTANEISQEPLTTTTKRTEAITTSVSGVVESSTTTITSDQAYANKITSAMDEIPGGPSSLISNKPLSSVQKEEDMDEDEQRSQTPKLDDISDEEPDPTLDNDDDDNDVDSINDPSKHPALAPHAQARMTDDETTMTDSTAATPQTEGNTPMPLLEEDDDMEEAHQPQPQVAHPLSQEIYSNIMANNDDVNSLNNDSPAIQTPEDIVNASDPHNPIQEQGQEGGNQPQE